MHNSISLYDKLPSSRSRPNDVLKRLVHTSHSHAHILSGRLSYHRRWAECYPFFLILCPLAFFAMCYTNFQRNILKVRDNSDNFLFLLKFFVNKVLQNYCLDFKPSKNKEKYSSIPRSTQIYWKFVWDSKHNLSNHLFPFFEAQFFFFHKFHATSDST